MKSFVYNCKYIYGNTFTVYNIHNLLHLPDDCINHKCSLNSISCFPFENVLQKLKKMVRSTGNPISKRQYERQTIVTKLQPKVTFNKISIGQRDNCFLTKDSVVFVRSLRSDNGYHCDVYKFKYLENVYESPIPSKHLNIFMLPKRNRRKFKKKIITEHDLLRKCVCLPVSNGFSIFPLLHEIENV